MPVTVRILTSKKERLYIIDEGAVGEIKKRQVLSLLIIFCCKHPKRNCLKGQNALALLEGCLYFACLAHIEVWTLNGSFAKGSVCYL